MHHPILTNTSSHPNLAVVNYRLRLLLHFLKTVIFLQCQIFCLTERFQLLQAALLFFHRAEPPFLVTFRLKSVYL